MSDSGSALKEGLDRLRRRAVTGQVRIVHELLGFGAANTYFWVAPRKGNPTWTDVQNRVEWLRRRNPDAVADFVVKSLNRTGNPVVVVGLARFPVTRDVTREWLLGLVRQPMPLATRIATNSPLAGSVIGAARILLDHDSIRALTAWMLDQYDPVPPNLFQVADTVGYRMTSSRDLDCRIRKTEEARHRLIITEALDDRRSIDLLMPGAKSTTLIATADTFGQAEVDGFAKAKGGGDVTVEHVRSRIARFSPEYIDFHSATVELATEIVEAVFEAPTLLDPAYRPAVEVHVADYLFFGALRVRGIAQLLDDDGFDQILVAIDDHSERSSYIRQLAAVGRLHTDPRVELVSISRRVMSYRRFWRLAAAIAGSEGRALAVPQPWIPDEIVWRNARNTCSEVAADMPGFVAGEVGKNLLLVTANSAAYNKATAAYAAELSEGFNLRVLQFGHNADTLTKHLERNAPGGTSIPLDLIAPELRAANSVVRLLNSRIGPVLERRAADPSEPRSVRLARAAVSGDLDRLSRNIGMFLMQVQALHTWFARMATQGSLPAAVVLTPQRHAGTSAAAAAARLHGVPSLAVEPHAQDANYCRYAKVAADYYGVLSDYFRAQTAHGFAIDIDRIRTIGSPRQVAPRNLDRGAARTAARESLRQSHGLTLREGQLVLGFFSQPLDWGAISKVWSSVLDAARTTGTQVLLKPHPEDSPSRVRQYLALVGPGDVLVVDGDVTVAIDASDIVSAIYSSAALDATLRQVPAVALADGDAEYPLDLSSIVGIPVARSAAEIVDILEAFKRDPAPFDERVSRFLERESQFVEGPGARLRAFVEDVIGSGPAGIRTASDLPQHLFLDAPHPVFRI